jgi:hypothetical protein
MHTHQATKAPAALFSITNPDDGPVLRASPKATKATKQAMFFSFIFSSSHGKVLSFAVAFFGLGRRFVVVYVYRQSKIEFRLLFILVSQALPPPPPLFLHLIPFKPAP